MWPFKVSFLAFLFLTLNISPCHASIELTEELNTNITHQLLYYFDETGKTDIRAALEMPNSKYLVADSNNKAFPTNDAKLWVKFTLKNSTNNPKKIYLLFAPSYLANIKIYDSTGGLHGQSGSTVQGDWAHSGLDLPMSLNVRPGEHEYIVGIQSAGIVLGLKIQSESEYFRTINKNQILFFLLIGAIIALALYHLFIYLTARERLYLYYVLYSASLVGAQLTLTSYGRPLFGPNTLDFPLPYLGSLLFSNLGYIAIALFTKELLQLNFKNRKMKLSMNLLTILSSVAILHLVIFQSAESLPITRGLGLLMIIIVLTIGIIEGKGGNRTAQYYLLSWAPVLFGIATTVLVLNGTIERTPITDWAVPTGAVLESLFLAMAIGNRLEKATKEKLAEQNLRIKAYEQIEENFEKLKQRDEVIRAFVRPSILAEVALKKEPTKYKPQYLNKSILFADLKNYTAMTEKISPENAYKILNQFFESINSAVFDNEGEVDKLIGDAVMATFNSPDQCLNAVNDFRSRLVDINKARVTAGEPAIYVSIGLTCGEVLSGNFGSYHKLDRTIVGDVVNLASRLEAVAKTYAADIVCTQTFIESITLPCESRPIDIVNIKGKKEPVLVYEIFSHSQQVVKKYKTETAATISQIIELKQRGNFDSALKKVEGLLRTCPAHTYREGEIMDPSLKAIRESILQWQQNAKGESNGSEKNAA